MYADGLWDTIYKMAKPHIKGNIFVVKSNKSFVNNTNSQRYINEQRYQLPSLLKTESKVIPY